MWSACCTTGWMFPGISRRRKRRTFLNPYTDNFLDGQADEHTHIRQVIGHPETFREAVEQLDAYGQCQPEHFAHQCPCQPQATKTYSPLAALLPEHITPELLFLETQWAALVSYGVTAQPLARCAADRCRACPVYDLGTCLHGR